MLIATFGPTTAWSGKKITRVDDTFILEGHGPISASDIMEYDRQGHLVWVDAGTRAWIGAKAQAAPASRITVPASDAAHPETSEPHVSTTGGGDRPRPRKRKYLERALLLAIVLLVVANMVLLLALVGAFKTHHAAEPPTPPASTPTLPVSTTSQAAVVQRTTPASQMTSWPTMFVGIWTHTSGPPQERRCSTSTAVSLSLYSHRYD